MQVVISGSTPSSYHGTGVANGWVTDGIIPPFWTGQADTNVGTGQETVEWAVDYASFGIQPCKTVFRLAGYHHWFGAVGNDYGWPSNQWFDQPRTWQPAILQAAPCGPLSGKIAYVYRGNASEANSFFSLLTGRGYSVTLIPLGTVLATDFSTFDLTIIADDTGNLNQWGIPTMTAAEVGQIEAAASPSSAWARAAMPSLAVWAFSSVGRRAGTARKVSGPRLARRPPTFTAHPALSRTQRRSTPCRLTAWAFISSQCRCQPVWCPPRWKRRRTTMPL